MTGAPFRHTPGPSLAPRWGVLALLGGVLVLAGLWWFGLHTAPPSTPAAAETPQEGLPSWLQHVPTPPRAPAPPPAQPAPPEETEAVRALRQQLEAQQRALEALAQRQVSAPANAHTPPPEKPKPWIWAKAEALAPPFPKPEPPPMPASPQSTLVQAAVQEQPADPTRVLYRSQVIPGLLLHAVQSDIPGVIRVMVTQDVTDRFGQGVVLVPQHSLILGRQAEVPQYGHTRLPIAIEELHFPDGRIVKLDGQIADTSGATGLPATVNNHYGKLVLGAFLSAALNVGARAPFGTPRGYHPNLAQEYSADVGRSLQRSSQGIIDRELRVPPSLTLKAGTPVVIELAENLSFTASPMIIK